MSKKTILWLTLIGIVLAIIGALLVVPPAASAAQQCTQEQINTGNCRPTVSSGAALMIGGGVLLFFLAAILHLASARRGIRLLSARRGIHQRGSRHPGIRRQTIPRMTIPRLGRITHSKALAIHPTRPPYQASGYVSGTGAYGQAGGQFSRETSARGAGSPIFR
jgi:hypothetical protein